jgi:hypothetical protein
MIPCGCGKRLGEQMNPNTWQSPDDIISPPTRELATILKRRG